MTELVRLWIIWAWDHMKSHLAYLRGIPNIEIVWVADKVCSSVEWLIDPRSPLNMEELIWFAPNPIFYNSASDLYASLLSFDAVFSGTPDRFHTGDIADAVKNWKHIMIEKPLATNHSELKILKESLEIARKNKLIISSCHARRFDPPFLWLKTNLEEIKEELGSVMWIDYDFSYAELRKRGIHEWLLIDHFNHEIDLLNFLLGFSHFTATKLTDSEEQYQASWVRHDWVSFMFRWSRFLKISRYHESMQIRFQKWTLCIDTSTGIATKVNQEHQEGTSENCWKTDYKTRLTAVNQNFINAIRWVEEIYLTHEDLIINSASWIELTEQWKFNSQNHI